MTHAERVVKLEEQMQALSSLTKNPEVGLFTWWMAYERITDRIQEIRNGAND